MARVEVSLSDRIDTEVEHLIDDGEFVNREQAIEELLTMGISAYETTEDEEDLDEDLFTQAVEDQQDPAIRDEDEEDHRF